MKTLIIIGIKPVDFVNDQSKQIKGVTLYLGRSVRDGLGYQQFTKAYIRNANSENYTLFSEVEPVYNCYGDVVGVKSHDV